MIGEFIIPACAPAGLRVTALLRNTFREGETVPLELRRRGMDVDVRVFENGVLRYHQPHFASVPLDGVGEVSAETCPALAGSQANLLVIARCTLPSASQDYFAQEHQLLYRNPQTGAFDALLYDQLPVPATPRNPSPIVLLAPKVWVGRHFTSYVAFANANATLESRPQARPMTVTVIDQAGHVLYSADLESPENSALLFDVRAAVRDRLPLGDEPTFLSVVARGGASRYAIMTFVVNEATGNFALEHSLSPHYYMTGDQKRLRQEALQLSHVQRET